MVLLLERSKLVVEGAGAVAVAALMHGRVEPPRRGLGRAPCCRAGTWTRRCSPRRSGWARPPRGGGWCSRRWCPTGPGALAGLLRVVADHGGNVVDVEHLRDGIDLHVRETAIKLVLQTRGPEHSQEILDAAREEGFSVRVETDA